MIQQLPSTILSSELIRNIGLIRDQMGNSADFIIRDIQIAHSHPAALIYLDGMVDTQALQSDVIGPLLDCVLQPPITFNWLSQNVIKASEITISSKLQAGLSAILSGSVLLIADQLSEGLIIALPGWDERNIDSSSTQPAVRGPQHAFIESLRTNTTLVRRKVKDTRVRIDTIQVGQLTKTDVALMYVSGLVDDQLVERLTKQLQAITADRVLEGEYLEELLLANKMRTIFPLLYNTDRPDVIAAAIIEGRIGLFIDGTPFVLVAPSFFVDFLQAAEDYYQSYIYSSMIRLLRYVSLYICMLAPAIYIALTTYHQDMLPTQLLLSLAAQREGVPFPAFVEALMMEITFEILREAGLRMPRTIGQAVSIVGTIVIGQAAVEAGIVSAVMVIVVAITAISSFVIPSYSMSIAIRILRFLFMSLAAIIGFYGITIGMFMLMIHLCHLQPLGISYMSPAAPYNKKEKRDTLFRFPYRN